VITEPLASLRGRTAARAWSPTARSVDWRTPGSAAVLAAALIVQQRLTDPGATASSFTLRAQLIAALVAVAVASILPDAAEALVDASPMTRAWRTGIRLSLVLLAWAATWALTLALISSAPGPVPADLLTRQAAVLLAVSTGAAAVRGPGAAAAAVALICLGSLVLPDPWSIAGDVPGAPWRLGLLAATGLAALGWGCRDHARRHPALPVRAGRRG
jgi:hypothetical protein